jgi:hypothetical protein
MADETTTNETWFAIATLQSQFSYVIACAVQDRLDAYKFWKSQDTVASAQIAADAKATYEAMRKLQDDFATGSIIVQRKRIT